MALKPWKDCSEETKSLIRSRWMVTDSVEAFDHWATRHAFYVKSDGQLDQRYQKCELVPDVLREQATQAAQALQEWREKW